MNIHKIAGFAFDNIGGNPAGVLITKEALSETQMQDIAKEVNYSETAFLVKTDKNTFRMRYFSPEMEISFCGHATIASGYVLANEFGLDKYELVLNSGKIDIDLQNIDGKIITSIKSIETSSSPINEDLIDKFIDLFNFEKEDLDLAYPVLKSYSGNQHLIIFVKDKKILSNMKYDFQKAKELCRNEEITTISIIYKENENTYHSRNAFAYGGVYEDPATGSAAVALGEYLRHTKIKTSGNITILQGFDMEVPCKLHVSYEEKEHSPIVISGESRVIK